MPDEPQQEKAVEPSIRVDVGGRLLDLRPHHGAGLDGVYLAARDGQSMRYFALREATASVQGQILCRLAAVSVDEAMSNEERRERLAKARAMEPIDYRAMHAPEGYDGPAVEPSEKQIVDSDGNIGAPLKVVDTITAMHRKGSITDAQLAAGRRFGDEFAQAHYEELKSPSMLRVTGSNKNVELSAKAAQAREEVGAAMTAVGGHSSLGGSCLWWVCGVGHSVGEWRTRQSMGRTQIGRDAASGILVGALSALAEHYQRQNGRKEKAPGRKARG